MNKNGLGRLEVRHTHTKVLPASMQTHTGSTVEKNIVRVNFEE